MMFVFFKNFFIQLFANDWDLFNFKKLFLIFSLNSSILFINKGDISLFIDFQTNSMGFKSGEYGVK
jgi:hypothetical protein